MLMSAIAVQYNSWMPSILELIPDENEDDSIFKCQMRQQIPDYVIT